MGYPLRIGFVNRAAPDSGGKVKNADSDVDDNKNLMEIMSFIAKSLNAT